MTNLEYHILTRCKNPVLLKLVFINYDYDQSITTSHGTKYMQEKEIHFVHDSYSYMDFDD